MDATNGAGVDDAQPRAYLRVTVLPNGGFTVEGPYNDPDLFYALIERAREAITARRMHEIFAKGEYGTAEPLEAPAGLTPGPGLYRGSDQ